MAEHDGSTVSALHGPDEKKTEEKGRASGVFGLTSEEAARRLIEYGRNELPEEKVHPCKIFLMQFVGPMPFMLECCILVSLIVACAGETSAWEDFGIILAMVVINACIGFHEERKAQASLDGLKESLTATVPCIRDGEAKPVDVAELVPGDVIMLRGGDSLPADCVWVEGDTVKVDTASLTGEPIPWNVPRPDKEGEEGSGRVMLSGFVVVQGECFCEVQFTGLETEIGKAAKSIMANSGSNVGFFEAKVMQVVNIIILFTLIIAAVVFGYQLLKRGKPWQQALLSILSLVIGAVPIALPLVVQVTMAIGAATMAKHKAIITHLTALQEIASMTVLNSDKTGTLTTAKMSIIKQQIFACEGYNADQLLLYAALASNEANLDDPIDRAIIQAAKEGLPNYAEEARHFTKESFHGFNAIVKRAVGIYNHPNIGHVKICKGLIDKVLETGDDEGEAGTWTVKDIETVRPLIKERDIAMSTNGYKTIGIAVSMNNGPMEFAGIVPMLDPPRHDTKLTIQRIRNAGIDVKMITGDHLNIAKETARLIDLGVRILPSTALWPASETRDQTIMASDGFAQVLPIDKQEIVLVEQKFGLVVGMTGDGVNDAAALSQAQVGIAVHGATDAAKNASDIILTEPGLSAIYTAVVESRKIFQRLRAYVLYRLAATIQIVVVLVVLAFVDDREIPPLFVVLLALLNDVSLTPISADHATPSPKPDVPTLTSLLFHSLVLGAALTLQTLLFWYFGDQYFGVDFHADPKYCADYQVWQCCEKNHDKYCTKSNFNYLFNDGSDVDWPEDGTSWSSEAVCSSNKLPDNFQTTCGYFYRETLTYIQISLAVEFLILSTRTTGFFLFSRPSWGLLAGVMGANVIVSILAVTPVLWIGDGRNAHTKKLTNYPNGHVSGNDLGYIWLYDIVWMFITDLLKMASFWAMGELTEGTLDPGGDVLPDDATAVAVENVRVSEMSSRSGLRGTMDMRGSVSRGSVLRSGVPRSSMAGRESFAPGGRASYMRPSMRTSLRPSTPANLARIVSGN